MPAFIAYLFAISLFLGGGYGTLYWLAQPEPAPKFAVGAEPRTARSAPREAAGASARTTGLAAGPHQQKSPSDVKAEVPPAPAPPESTTSAVEKVTPPPVPAPHPAVTEPVSSASANSEPAQPPAPEEKKADPAAAEPAATADNRKPSARKQASRRSSARSTRHARRDGRNMQVMTLRTIQYPDGSRRSYLVPHIASSAPAPRPGGFFDFDDGDHDD